MRSPGVQNSSWLSFLIATHNLDEEVLDNHDYKVDLDYFDNDVYSDDAGHGRAVHREEDYAYHPKSYNHTGVELGYEFENDDSAWVMACVFIIFTMQTGNINI